MALVGTAIGGAGAIVVGIPFVGFLMGPLLKHEPDVWRSVGAAASFQVGATREVTFPNASPELWAGVAGRSAAWLRRESEDSFIAFSINCTHLGCPVRWLAEAELFMCPCHGGVYYKDGSVAAGPPSSALVRYPVRVRDGTVEVRTSPLPIVG
ncbi:MAG: Rieske (2Fe-2S) protein [Dehalococcoidia bacterium]